ncbi:copper chaperone PCu(A)C [Gordonia zhaorongruii]|uniref:copper chaperone PCu(A)C n=1 Tax=Gordonia zhaorongruii TaxID=2597659 RepID=UPI00104CCC25|nr:copper chaperone PCu(A)C [Gordonia zhaorongruii]
MARRHILRSARLTALAAATVASIALLGACSTDSTDNSPEADAVTVSAQWVKAVEGDSHGGMTAAFAKIANGSDRDVRIVSASSDASEQVQLHEVVDSGGTTTMKEKDGGFVVPSNGSLTMTPGGEHFMFMGVQRPIRAGQQVAITVRFADGSTTRVDALARDFDGNQENYSPDHSGEHR